MDESITPLTNHFTACATLAAIGAKLKQLDLFGPIRAQVQIRQKTVKHTLIDKLTDTFISLLAGAQGLVEINTRLRADPGLQRAFGRATCAEQSVVQETLDACTAENVGQLRHALDEIDRSHSQGFRHDYQASWQLLDVDMSGLPCGPKAAFATRGYFAGQYHRRGRQVGRVLATHYQEVVVDQLFAGNVPLVKALQPLVQAAETTLRLDEAKRARTILRVDAGAGTLEQRQTNCVHHHKVVRATFRVIYHRYLRATSDKIVRCCDVSVMYVGDTLSEDCREVAERPEIARVKENNEMMTNMMPSSMMDGGMLFWTVLGVLLILALLSAAVWLLANWLNAQRTHQRIYAPQPKDAYLRYEQGYQPPQRMPEIYPETYQEGGRRYTYPQPQDEQTEAQYQRDMPLQY